MRITDGPRPGYRPCVGIMLINREGLVFTARRLDTPGNAWQMPQGGIDPGESPETAALRELREEIGTDSAEILAETRSWYSYDLPENLRGKLWGGGFSGQTQKWFLLRFTGADGDIDLDGEHPEFSEWRWTSAADLPRHIVPFKRDVYAGVLAEFRDLIGQEPG